jgi:hypothetical protein
MSVPTMFIVCDNCDFKQDNSSHEVNYWYVLPDGVFIPLLYESGWCEQCGAIRDVEVTRIFEWEMQKRKAVNRLYKIHSKARFWNRWLLRLLNFDWARKIRDIPYAETLALTNTIADFDDGIRYVASRTQGARCLACGSQAIQAPFFHQLKHVGYKASNDYEDLGAEHPVCGGRLWNVPAPSGVWLHMRPSFLFYDVYGQKIDEPENDFSFEALRIQRGIFWDSYPNNPNKDIWAYNSIIRSRELLSARNNVNTDAIKI